MENANKNVSFTRPRYRQMEMYCLLKNMLCQLKQTLNNVTLLTLPLSDMNAIIVYSFSILKLLNSKKKFHVYSGADPGCKLGGAF